MQTERHSSAGSIDKGLGAPGLRRYARDILAAVLLTVAAALFIGIAMTSDGQPLRASSALTHN